MGRRHLIAAIAVALALVGCDEALDQELPEHNDGARKGAAALTGKITGTLRSSGPRPSGYTFNLYSTVDNADAFDSSYCDGYDGSADCYGRVRIEALGEPTVHGPVTWDGNVFTITDIDPRASYYLQVTGTDASVVCSSDFFGFEEPAQLATSESALTFSVERGGRRIELPRDASIACGEVLASTDFPDRAPPEVPLVADAIDENGDITSPPVVEWSSFQLLTPDGSVFADASDENIATDACLTDLPSQMRIAGTVLKAEAAYIRIQYGAGEDASFQTFKAALSDDGSVNEMMSLAGTYVVVQLDTNEHLDGKGESRTITLCEQADRPAQQLWAQITWDTPGTNVDIFAFNEEGGEIAYYSPNPDWGELVVEDSDGYGPETITTNDGEFNNGYYLLRARYTDDAGMGPTLVTGRAIYYDSATDRVCDVIADHVLTGTGDWWDHGIFGPGDCPDIAEVSPR